MSKPTLDARDFRRALGQFPTGVTIITTQDENGKPIGVTASSFNAVSLDPPLVLWSVDKRVFSAPIMSNAEHFAVNVLSKNQIEIANQFAVSSADKFAAIACTEDPQGCPLFAGCVAQFECKTWNVYEGGDHLIIVGEVLDYRYIEGGSPLVFTGGAYAVPMHHPTGFSNQTVKVPGNGFLGDYILYLLRIVYTRCSAQLYLELMDKHGIAPEEWRLLTLLGDAGEAEPESVAQSVGQPLIMLHETVERMVEKGFVNCLDNGKIGLTESGTEVAERLFEIAKSQEDLMLSGLSEQQRTDLKFALKHVAGNSD